MEKTFIESMLTLLKETFDGPSENASWYTEAKPGSGLIGTLEQLSAEEASVLVNGATIAAHTDHTRYYLWVTNTVLKGGASEWDWSLSWRITSVDEPTWTLYKKQLQEEYAALLANLHLLDPSDENKMNGALGSLAHSAYHLGAIRQMIKAVKTA